MFCFDPELKVYLHRDAIDFRVGLNGLAGLAEQVLGINPFEQALFEFRNKRRDRVRVLGWQRNGFWMLMKRLGGPLHLARCRGRADADGRAVALAARRHQPGSHAQASAAPVQPRCLNPAHAERRHGMLVKAAVSLPATITAEDLSTLIAERDALAGALRVANAERDLALERLKALQGQLFAAKSEARSTDQKELFLNEAEQLAPTDQTPPAQTEEEEIDASRRPPAQKRGRKPLDPALPREFVRHELPEAERVCAHGGHALVEIGAEISEKIGVIPEQVRVLQHRRIKYACLCCDQGLKNASIPARIIPRGLLTMRAQAWVITGKYQFGMPLYRTAALLRRFGDNLASNTPAGVMRIGQAVQPVINLLRDHLLDSELIYGDETTAQVLKEPGCKAQT